MIPVFLCNRAAGAGAGAFLISINPVQFPLHEPYFDLTPIKVTHTKTSCLSYQTKSPKLKINTSRTYCTYSFRRLTSGQYLSEIKFTVPYLYTITSNSYFTQSSYRLQFIVSVYPVLGDQLNFTISHPFVRLTWHVYSPQYLGHDDLSQSLLSDPIQRGTTLYKNKERVYVNLMELTKVSRH